MSSFTLTNIATDIDSAITRVVGADTAPTTASQNMVTSGGVKAAIDAIGSGSAAIITTDSFTDASLDSFEDGLSNLDTAIPTSKTVTAAISAAGTVIGSITSLSAGTTNATTDLFITITGRSTKTQNFSQTNYTQGTTTLTIGSGSNAVSYYAGLGNSAGGAIYSNASAWVKKGETFTITFGGSSGFPGASAIARSFNFTP